MEPAGSFPFALRPVSTGPVIRPRQQRGSKRLRFVAGATLVALAGMGLKSASYASLDRLADQPDPLVNPVETPGETFIGSAFFFAQGAFDADPQAEATTHMPHVLALRRVDTALAAPFAGATALDRYRALNCLTSAIYYEAGNEPDEGQRAVAQVVLNRVRHPAWPNSVCGVVYQGAERTDMLCQFTFSCDGAMARMPAAQPWARARRAAEVALSGKSFAPVGLATFYHTLAVRPSWSSKLDPVAVVGAHIFYQMRGANGLSSAFRFAYSGRELISGPPPRVWKPVPANAIPEAMPFLPEVELALRSSASIPGVPLSATAQPATQRHGTSPSAQPGWVPSPQVVPDLPGQRLPQSTIRPEYQNSGRPLI